MKSVKFTNIKYESSTKITFEVFDIQDEHINNYKFFYEFSCENHPSYDALALSFSCMLGIKLYDQIYIDLDLSRSTINAIRSFNQCVVGCRQLVEEDLEKKSSTNDIVLLNFSGGMDSLAALSLFPKDKIKIISIEFNGRFNRESDFFKEFHPYILRTNFRESDFFKKLESKSWQFMGIGSILYCEKFKAKYFTFGTILEADNNLNCNVQSVVKPFSGADLSYISAINGLTEVGTTKLAYECYGEKISKSLKSLADEGTVKRLRKDLLASLFSDSINIHSVKNFKFGKDYVFDFLCFYFIKNKGIKFISQYISNIPEEVIDLTIKLNLKFYEKLNPKALITFNNSSLYDFYIVKLFSFGFGIYDENDYYELSKVRACLSKFYKQENKHKPLYCKCDREKLGRHE